MIVYDPLTVRVVQFQLIFLTYKRRTALNKSLVRLAFPGCAVLDWLGRDGHARANSIHFKAGTQRLSSSPIKTLIWLSALSVLATVGCGGIYGNCGLGLGKSFRTNLGATPTVAP